MSNSYASALVLRNSNLAPLSAAQLKAQCPAIYSTEAHPDVSKRYGFINTKDVLDIITGEGFVPVEARNYSRRNASLLQFTRHMLKFRPAGNLEKVKKVGDVIPQLVMVGSHDRSSNFEVYGGLFRLVCSNGMMVSAGRHVEPVKLRHTSNIVEGVKDAVQAVVKQHSKVFSHVTEMQKIKLNDRQQIEFASKALELRDAKGMIKPEDLLAARRKEDEGADVWRVFNRVQENIMKGGLQGVTADNRITRTAGITSMAADLRINSALWNLAIDATL